MELEARSTCLLRIDDSYMNKYVGPGLVNSKNIVRVPIRFAIPVFLIVHFCTTLHRSPPYLSRESQ